MYIPRWAVYVLLAASGVAQAHEFWIEPQRFEVAAADHIAADLRVGQYFKGNSQVYLPDQFVVFSVTDPAGTRSVEGRLGDLPAARVPAARSGLHVLAYHSVPKSITYEDLAQFERFAHKQGLDWVIDAHQRRGLPDTDITEAYTRYAKTLVAVDNGTGNDHAIGLPFELIAETNPYTSHPGDDIRVRLLYRGKAHRDAQITVFRKFVGCEATRSTVHTDADGRADVPVTEGGRFLVNAVHIKEPGAKTLERIDAQWESLWASLTFEVQETQGGEKRSGCETDSGEAPILVR